VSALHWVGGERGRCAREILRGLASAQDDGWIWEGWRAGMVQRVLFEPGVFWVRVSSPSLSAKNAERVGHLAEHDHYRNCAQAHCHGECNGDFATIDLLNKLKSFALICMPLVRGSKGNVTP
jgi:hypothetical protein